MKILSNGLVYWNEKDIHTRELVQSKLLFEVKDSLRRINNAIQVLRVETPCLIPQVKSKQFPLYNIDDRYSLRAESTKGTYDIMDIENHKLPVCLYQINKSFRDEKSEAMRPIHLRYREFWQMEFQLFSSATTKADYHQLFIEDFRKTSMLFYDKGIFDEVPKEELPIYSTRTTDIFMKGNEVASLSTRNDYIMPVFEMSFGLDRLLQLVNF